MCRSLCGRACQRSRGDRAASPRGEAAPARLCYEQGTAIRRKTTKHTQNFNTPPRLLADERKHNRYKPRRPRASYGRKFTKQQTHTADVSAEENLLEWIVAHVGPYRCILSQRLIATAWLRGSPGLCRSRHDRV